MFAARPNSIASVPVNPIPVFVIADDVVDPTDASCSVGFQTGSLLTTTGNSSSASSLWFTPQLANAGNSYWIRLTVTAGSAPTSGDSTASWLALSSNRSWTWAQTVIGNKTATVTIEIASDSGGSNIVASQTGISVSAQVTL